MDERIIAYDLGTGGVKASLHDARGVTLCTSFHAYATFYPEPERHEQRPGDWWRGVCATTKALLRQSGVPPQSICALGISGHSLVSVPLGKEGNLLEDYVPIWSDTRSTKQAEAFFRNIPYEEWYSITGNGDPAATYAVMKLLWQKENRPDVFEKTDKVLGSKDYINYLLTGEIATDQSYASGSGVYDLLGGGYREDFIEAAGLPRGIFPDILPSHGVVGRVSRRAAEETGLAEGTLVACGGVDNSCMALGARGVGEGRAYTSLGSSSWIAVTTREPFIDPETRPFTFAHIEEGYYTSAVSIFAAGSAHKWAVQELFGDIAGDEDAYEAINARVARVPIGSHGVLFNPSMAGGSAQEPSQYIRGGFIGLALHNTREDMVRAVLEGVAMNLRAVLRPLETRVSPEDDMLLCGGGSKSAVWRQIFANVYNRRILKTNVDQDAASLGAAATACRACGLWADYAALDSLQAREEWTEPVPSEVAQYESLMRCFLKSRELFAEYGDFYQEVFG